MRFNHNSKQAWSFAKYFAKHFNDIGCSQQAAALTFSTLLAIVPILAVVFSAITIFPGFSTISAHVQDLILQNFVESSGLAIQNYLQDFLKRAGQLSKISSIAMMFTAVLLIFNIESCLNTIWQVKKRRPLIIALILYLSILLIVPILICGSLLLTSYFLNWHPIVLLLQWIGIKHIAISWLGLAFSAGVFIFLYQCVPNTQVPFKYSLLSGLFAAILFELAKHIFAAYIAYLANYRAIYGALSAFPIFLLWIYICWLITLAGSVMGYVLTHPYLNKRFSHVSNN